MNMDEGVRQQIQEIKQDLRAYMNGIASAAMRQTEDYRVNFGVELPRLQTLAAELPRKHELAQELWKESVRECRILATMIQPIDTFCREIADIWVESIRTTELAQIASMYLFSKVPYATDMAFGWIASDNVICQLCGYSVLCRIIRQNELSERSADELVDQACAVLNGDCEPLKKAALSAVREHAAKSPKNARTVVEQMKKCGLGESDTGKAYIEFVSL